MAEGLDISKRKAFTVREMAAVLGALKMSRDAICEAQDLDRGMCYDSAEHTELRTQLATVHNALAKLNAWLLTKDEAMKELYGLSTTGLWEVAAGQPNKVTVDRLNTKLKRVLTQFEEIGVKVVVDGP